MLSALLAIALATQIPARLVTAVERLPLPRVEGPISVRVDAMGSRVAIDAPRGAPSLARALTALARVVCPTVEPRADGVDLRCRSQRIEGALVKTGGASSIEIRELSGLPWTGDAAMPVVFHDPAELGVTGCADATLSARGECLLRDGRREQAADSFRRGADGPSPGKDHALLRLGDLALAGGDPSAALGAWALVTAEPWARLAAARRCELSSPCLAESRRKTYDPAGLPPSFARELRLREARARALDGEPLEAASSLAAEWGPLGACADGGALCRRIVLAALRQPGARPEEALALYSAGVRSDEGPYALELAEASSRLAAAAGAPGYAAALLASTAGRVKEPALGEHLLRTAELYLEAADSVRAAVVLDFARSHLGAATLRGARWAAVAKAAARRASRAATAAVAAPPELSRARAVLARAQALPGNAP